MIFDGLIKRLVGVMEKNPQSLRYYAQLIGILPQTLKSFIYNGTEPSIKVLVLIKKFVDKEEKKG